jgi:hypothetical protein
VGTRHDIVRDILREPDTGEPIAHCTQAADPGSKLRDIIRSRKTGIVDRFNRLQLPLDSAHQAA